MRTEADIQAGYKRYRGECKKACEAVLAGFPQLRLVRGHIFVPHWPTDPEQPHWWLEAPDGRIVDPTWAQFPFSRKPNKELYTEFNGVVTCANCGCEGQEKDFSFDSNYAFCSSRCYGAFVGVAI